MKSKNFNIYQINDKKESELFNNALIFFDTSALLDFYYYSDQTTSEIFSKIFKALKGRLLITHQTEFEFLKNRNTVLQKPLNSYDDLINVNKFQKDSGHISRIDELIQTFKLNVSKELAGQFKTLKEKTTKADKHPFLDTKVYSEFERKIDLLSKYLEGFENNFKSFKNDIKTEIESKKQSLSKELETDNILKQFQKTVVTTPDFKHHEILELIKEGELRYRNEIPPGYLDEEEKLGFQKYGDLIVWKQILEEAKRKSQDVILIINDLKEDWWHYEKKEYPIGPRFELVKEFNDYTGNSFWMYSINDFLYKSKIYFNTNIEEEIIQDVKNIVKPWPVEEQAIVVDWLYTYFKDIGAVEFQSLPADSGIDYTMITKENKICFQHKSTQKGMYTGLFIPLREAYSKKNFLKEEYGFDKFVYVLESKSFEIADKLTQHLGRKNPQKIISEMTDDFQLIIAHRNNDGMAVLYDSDT